MLLKIVRTETNTVISVLKKKYEYVNSMGNEAIH